MNALSIFLLGTLLLAGCKEGVNPGPVSEDPVVSEDPSGSAEPSLSDDPIASEDPSQEKILPEILTFSLAEYPDADVTISEDYTITVQVPKGASRSALTAVFTMPEGVTSRPESGTVMNFTSAQKIFLSAPDNTARKYVVTVVDEPYHGTALHQVILPQTLSHVYVRGKEVHLKVPYGTDLSSVEIQSVMSDGATGSPAVADAREPFTYTVTAEDGVSKAEYTISVDVLPQDRGVRGVYLPDPAHTSSFITPENVRESIALMKELRFNCLFVCAWARSKAAWDSKVLLDNSTYTTEREGNLYANYSGDDALADIITEAHKQGIKVILWFEYGFMHNAGGVNWNNPVLAKHPGWIGRGKDGEVASYNGTDFYYNAYDPEVRQFMLDLMAEALRKYPDVDGIQGDDRLPAMPRESGYNEATVALYCAQTGKPKPTDDRDASWSRWRLDILNGFASDMAKLARSKGKIISFAPNKYPWCESVLMQEWPVWVKAGDVDILNVQLYITGRYESDLADTVPYAAGTAFSPSMILKNGSAIMQPQMIADEFYANREEGTACETQFWFDGLKEKAVADTFRKIYSADAIWPL